jgi:hypothetical protein
MVQSGRAVYEEQVLAELLGDLETDCPFTVPRPRMG